MKKGWLTRRLCEVTTKIGSGATPRGGGESYKAEGISLIRSLNVYDGGFREAKLARIDDEQAADLSNVVVESHDVLLNITGASIARCCRVPADFLPARVNQHVSIIRPIKEKLDPDFLHYLLISNIYKGRLLHTGEEGGSTRQAITKAQLQEFVIEFPDSLPEQHRIVAILNKAFDGIAKARTIAEKNLQNARTLFESHLQSKLAKQPGWEGKTLRQVSLDFGRGKSKHRPRNDPKLYGGPYPFIQTGDVRGCEHLITEFNQTYSEAGLAQSKLWPKGTLCITIAANIAETGILGFDSCFPDSVIGVVVDPKQTSNSFLEYLLQSVKASLKAKGKGSAQDNINLATFENEPFYFPDLTVQKQIVGQLSDLNAEVQRLESIYQQKLDALDELKQSLLHQAFSGNL
ncbi:Type I restriction-modification system, specificity subunit S [Pseudomonas sp. 8BK]|uniref:restriction endonuclease subunit S n=1 Tax=Pseudomonas sp. 8BK TaxID=2653164 RepID=UPI0012F34384|nr:restriction endonuclease subunit S [Pseudomonas sp. 8BK]VXC51995.1 Type I restriction-modification system, specificity subunit S [Pseudomonas sp. 8BK]